MLKVVITSLLISQVIQAQSTPTAIHQEQADSEMNSAVQKIIIDSDIGFEEALSDLSIPENVKNELVLETVYYYGFDDELHQGQILININALEDIKIIFEFIRQSRFPIKKVVPINNYNWSDDKSMEDNNTSCFNYRFVSGSRILSKHASGMAIDINPKQNPYVKNGNMIPSNAVYDTTAPGTLTSNSELVKEFKKLGWYWGGDWKSLKDYQHFQKEIEP